MSQVTALKAFIRTLRIKHILFAGLPAACVILFAIGLPKPLFHDPVSTVLFDRNGVLLGARIADDGQWRFPEATAIPEKLKVCVIAFEDRYFYRHPGFNPGSLVRALVQNIRAKRIVRGGSTLTMQVIRLARKGKPRTVGEKCIEIILATRLEWSASKEEILRLYCSHAPYGGNVVGLEAASWRYFGVSSPDLSWAEAALLAELPNSPSLMHPGKNRTELTAKRNRLLERMWRDGKMDSMTCGMARLEAVPDMPVPLPHLAPHLLSRVYGLQPDKPVRSTIDASLQARTADIVNRYHAVYRYNEIQSGSPDRGGGNGMC